MDVQLLGPVRIVHEGRRHEIKRPQARAVLVLLSRAPGRPMTFDWVLGELWPVPSGNARNAMQAAVARLRKLIGQTTGGPGDDIVRTVGQSYVLDLPDRAIDAARFLALAERGGALVASAPETAAGLLQEALDLWQGPALADAGDASAFRIEAAHLDECRVTAWESLLAARLALGGGSELVTQLRLLSNARPERERFAEYLMVALYRSGRQTEAITVFHRTRRWLADEMGLAPGDGMHRCYEAILKQDCLLG